MACVGSVLFAFVTGASADDGPSANRWIKCHTNVIYGKKSPESQRLDAYLVQADHPTPALIEIHGGGFRSGRKSAGANRHERFFQQDWVYMRALRAGISVISIDYRLSPRHPFPAQVEDVTRAVQFVRSKAKEWNIDPTRIAACGSSAGGHLSAWIGLHDDLADPKSDDPVEKHSTRLSAIVNISGPIDYSRFDPVALQKVRRGAARTITDFIGCSASEYNRTAASKKAIRLASPIQFVSPDDPPTMLVYASREGEPKGEAPRVIHDAHSAWFGVLMSRELEKNKVVCEKRIGRSGRRSQQAKAIVDFLEKHLEPKATLPAAATRDLRGPDAPESSGEDRRRRRR